jgi:CPA1 family monovalent cation:H+ antiporter
VVVFGLVPQLARLRDSEPVSRAYQLVMFWGGLRGAIALAIVLSLPEFALRDTLIAVVTGAVLFTLLVQGLSIEWLVKRLGLDRPTFADQLAQREAALHAKTVSLAGLERLEQGEFFSSRVAGRLRQESVQRIAELRGEISALTAGMTSAEARRILSMRTLAREKSRFEELFRRGLVEEWAYRTLIDNVEQQLDDIKHFNRLPGAPYPVSPAERLLRSTLRLISPVPLLGKLGVRYQRRAMMRDYQVFWGRYRAARSVLKNLEEIASENGVSGRVIEEVRQAYQALLESMHSQLLAAGEEYPEFVEAAQEKLAHRLQLISEQDAIDRSAQLGVIAEGVAQAVTEDYQRQLRALRRKDLSAFLAPPDQDP